MRRLNGRRKTRGGMRCCRYGRRNGQRLCCMVCLSGMRRCIPCLQRTAVQARRSGSVRGGGQVRRRQKKRIVTVCLLCVRLRICGAAVFYARGGERRLCRSYIEAIPGRERNRGKGYGHSRPEARHQKTLHLEKSKVEIDSKSAAKYFATIFATASRLWRQMVS